MGKKNGRTRIQERDGYGQIVVYTKPHTDLSPWSFNRTEVFDPDYVVLAVFETDSKAPREAYQIRKATLIKALTR